MGVVPANTYFSYRTVAGPMEPRTSFGKEGVSRATLAPQSITARDITSLVTKLGRPHSRPTRDTAEKKLRAIGKQAEPRLIRALKREENQFVRARVAKILGSVGSRHAVNPLCDALWARGAFAREAAARALGQLGDRRAVSPLMAAMITAKRDLGIEILVALGKIGGSDAVDFLIDTAAINAQAVFRRVAVDALGVIGDPRSVDVLVDKLGDLDKQVRINAEEALRNNTWPAETRKAIELVLVHD